MNTKSSARKQRLIRLISTFCATILFFFAQTVQANPVGGNVVNGSADFATSGNTLTVTNTPGTIINWQGFSINSNEVTNFAQQSASSTVLNRVVGNDPSNILGTLQSNGRVFLVNPNGILFGAGAVVDVAGLVASTLNLSDADFKAGNYHFTEMPGAGNISNAGNITAQDNGQIYLIAPNVENTGIITAPNGEILLAAGYSVDLVSTSDPNLRVNITAPAGHATNIGQLIASSGSLGLFGTVVSNNGIVSADSATMQGGKIVFKASQRVEAGGTISAQGAGGGTINLLADMQSGTVNVTGTLDASAPVSGNGGFIDTSAAHVKVADTARITTAATNGNSGTWLIDPTDYVIAAADPGGGSYMSNTVLAASLGNGNVTIQTLSSGAGNGDIYVNDAVSWTSANNLTLNAIRNVNIDAAISNSGSGNLILRADLNGVSNGGTIIFGGSGSVAMNGGRADLYYDAYIPASDLYTSTDFSKNITGTYTAWMLVNDVNQLQAINTDLAGDYALGTNIDASVTQGWIDAQGVPAGFVPLGNGSTTFFTGKFDGLGHTISNLHINQSLGSNVGLFGYVSGGSISNVGLENAVVKGYSNVGALAGWNGGIISNSYVNGGSVIATLTDGLANAGGLVGYNSGSISNTYASGGTVNGIQNTGGLVGYNDVSGSISYSYASNAVRGVTYFGGVVGYNDSSGGAVVNASFWNTTTAGASVVNGIGYDTALSGGIDNGAIGLDSAGMMTMSNFTAAGWDISASGTGTTWHITQGITMPLLSFSSETVTGARNVINEIVDITSQRKKPKPEDLLAAEDTPGTTNQSLPMCN
jgi:filamentous hemagglutinin family protein